MRCSTIPSHDYEADCSLAGTYFKIWKALDSFFKSEVDDPTTQIESHFPYFSPGKTRLRKVRIVSSKEGYAGLRHRSLADGTMKMLNGCSSFGSSSIKFFRQLPKWPRTLSYFSWHLFSRLGNLSCVITCVRNSLFIKNNLSCLPFSNTERLETGFLSAISLVTCLIKTEQTEIWSGTVFSANYLDRIQDKALQPDVRQKDRI